MNPVPFEKSGKEGRGPAMCPPWAGWGKLPFVTPTNTLRGQRHHFHFTDGKRRCNVITQRQLGNGVNDGRGCQPRVCRLFPTYHSASCLTLNGFPSVVFWARASLVIRGFQSKSPSNSQIASSLQKPEQILSQLIYPTNRGNMASWLKNRAFLLGAS